LIRIKYGSGRKVALFHTFSHLLGNASVTVKAIVHPFFSNPSRHCREGGNTLPLLLRIQNDCTTPAQRGTPCNAPYAFPFLPRDPRFISALFSSHQAHCPMPRTFHQILTTDHHIVAPPSSPSAQSLRAPVRLLLAPFYFAMPIRAAEAPEPHQQWPLHFVPRTGHYQKTLYPHFLHWLAGRACHWHS
jgi:hypothetical protein